MRTRLPRDAGVSLIEILVGVSILSIVAFAVTLSVQPPADPLQVEATRLAVRLDQASQEAIATGQPVGLVIGGFGETYGFYRYVDGRWWALSDHPTLRERQLPEGVQIDLSGSFAPVDADAGGAVFPAFWFDPAGLTEPFRLRLQSSDHAVELARDGAGTILVSELG
jgi:general secretion pathway protein H